MITVMESQPVLQASELVEFEALLRAHYADGFRLAIAMVHDRADAEDVLQAASTRAWRKWSTMREPRAARAWFLAIVANECRTSIRHKWQHVLRLAEPPRASPEVDAEGAIEVRLALTRLPRAQRLVIILRYYLDMSYAEVAAVLGTSETAARARGHRALRKLEPHLPLRDS